MRKNKIGVIFIIVILAIAGIGISYAGFSDKINLYGTVNTGKVKIEIEDYSGMEVWKVWGENQPTDELFYWHGFINNVHPGYSNWEDYLMDLYPNCEYEREAYAWASPEENNDEVIIEFNNIFPCLDFSADFVFHYVGSIPAKLCNITFDYDDGFDFTDYISWKAFRCLPDDSGGWIILEEEIFKGAQFHNCDYVYIDVTIHLPQENDLQDLEGRFKGKVEVIQWNEYLNPYCTNTVILNSIADTFINAHVPGGNNNDRPFIRIRGLSSGWHIYSLINFDFSSIPQDAQILEAKLYMKYFTQVGEGIPTGHVINLHRLLDEWDENIVTWNNQPSHSSIVSSFDIVPSAAETWMEWDVTDDVQYFVNNLNQRYGWKIIDIDSSNSIPYFHSREADENNPYLEITYT